MSSQGILTNSVLKIPAPDISVIIPARNEEKYLGACLESVRAQTFASYEIIVVDNGSTDSTAVIAESMGVKVVSEPVPGLPRARERGRRAAAGTLLTYLDADMIIPPDYLSVNYEYLLEHPEVAAVSNPYLFYDGDRKIRILSEIYFKRFLPLSFALMKLLKLPIMLMGGNFTVRAGALNMIGGFNSNIDFYGEDVDISKRISKTGKIAFLNRMVTYTSARRYAQQGTFRTFLIYLINYFTTFFFNRAYSHPLSGLRPVIRWTAFSIILAALVLYGFADPKSEIFGHTIFRINSPGKVIALTFDDGPNGEYTNEILGILNEEHIIGTFFLIGKNVERYPDIARNIVAAGNSIGNHSYSHSYTLPFRSVASVADEVTRAETAIFNATRIRPSLFRPPHGFRTPWMVHSLHDMGYQIYTWNDMTTDYRLHVKPEKIAKRILSKVKSDSIIVLHDGLNLSHPADRENTVAALKIIISELKEEGYRFVALNEIAGR